MMLKKFAIAVALSGLLSGVALAQGSGSSHSGHQNHGASSPVASSAADLAYGEAMAKMHKDMDIKLSGNADVDFVRGMIPHHQGAIDMAKVMLEHGKDPELKALATAIIQAQEVEIEWMKAWLEKHGG